MKLELLGALVGLGVLTLALLLWRRHRRSSSRRGVAVPPPTPPQVPDLATTPTAADAVLAQRQAVTEALRQARQRQAEDARRRAAAPPLAVPPAPPVPRPARPMADLPARPMADLPARPLPDPPAAAAALPPAAAPPTAPAPRPPGPVRVLLADDSKLVRVKTGRLLAQQGWQVLLAEDGLAALALLESAAPDLLITDVEMPGLDGFALARRVRGDARWCRLPVMMITGSDDKHAAAAAAAGVDRLLGKPYDDKLLLDEARRMLADARSPALPDLALH